MRYAKILGFLLGVVAVVLVLEALPGRLGLVLAAGLVSARIGYYFGARTGRPAQKRRDRENLLLALRSWEESFQLEGKQDAVRVIEMVRESVLINELLGVDLVELNPHIKVNE